MRCKSCGRRAEIGDAFCGKCGTSLEVIHQARHRGTRIYLASGLILSAAIALGYGGWWYFTGEPERQLWPRVAGAGGGCGLIDERGRFVLNPTFEGLRYNTNLDWIGAARNGRSGFINGNGEQRVPFRFDAAWPPFAHGDQRPLLIEGDRVGFVALNGTVIEPRFEQIQFDPKSLELSHLHFDFLRFDSEGVAVVYETNGQDEQPQPRFIDRNGAVILPLNEYSAALPFDNGPLAPVRDRASGRWGLIDREGRLVLPPTFEAIGTFGTMAFTIVRTNNAYRMLNRDLQLFGPILADVGDFAFMVNTIEGWSRLAVKIGDRWGFLDRSGEVAIAPQFDEVKEFLNSRLAPVRVGSMWGFIDTSGRMIVNPQFEDAFPVSGSFAPVDTGNGWGFVTEAGSIISQNFQGFRLPHERGLIAVQVGDISNRTVRTTSDRFGRISVNHFGGGSWGFIDSSGAMIISPIYEDTRPFIENGVAPVRLNGRWGFINALGEMVIQPQFDAIDVCPAPPSSQP